MINIAGTTPVDDPSYRYKMPRLVPKVEGRGNGIKTVLVNVVDLGTSLNRDGAEITKFFGFELGAQTTYSDDRAIVNGAHNQQDLQHLLSKYIELFVLCPNCKLPETQYRVKSSVLFQKCLACGSKESCDMAHKLTAFILKTYKKEKEAEKKDKKEKEKNKKSKDDKTESKDRGDDSGDEGKVKKEKKKKDKKKKEEDEVEEGEFEEATDSEAVDAAIEQFKIWLNNSKAEGSKSSGVLGAPVSSIINELRSIQTLSSLPPSDRPIIYLGATFSVNSIGSNDVMKHRDILSQLAPKDIQQRQLIAATEWFCGTKYPELVRKFPIMLKQLYDADLVEEEVFYAWSTDYTRNEFSAESSLIGLDTLEALKEAAKPFITWLQSAEEEGEDEQTDQEDESKEEL